MTIRVRERTFVSGSYALNAQGLCAEYCGNRHTFIPIRKRVGGHYEEVFICDACWNQDNPGRVPVRLRSGT